MYRPLFANAHIKGGRLLTYKASDLEAMGVKDPAAQQIILSKTKHLLKDRVFRGYNTPSPLLPPRGSASDDSGGSHGLNPVPPLARTPSNLSPLPIFQVPRWTPEHVQAWLSTSGFEKLIPAFQAAQMDGAALMRLDEIGALDLTGLWSDDPLFARFWSALQDLQESSKADRTPTGSPILEPQATPQFVQRAHVIKQRSNLAIVSGPGGLAGSSTSLQSAGKETTLEISSSLGAVQPKFQSLLPKSTAGIDSALNPNPPAAQAAPVIVSIAQGWTVAEVGDWLERIGQGKYRSAFDDARIHGPSLLRLKKDNIIAIGASETDAEALESAIYELINTPASSVHLSGQVAVKPGIGAKERHEGSSFHPPVQPLRQG